jgi:hypothetical protein
VTATATEALTEGKGAPTSSASRGTRKARANALGGGETQRFFLAKPGSAGGTPELGREFSGEPEAIVESLKTGLNYFIVSEWRGVADFSGKKPQLGREAARSAPQAG